MDRKAATLQIHRTVREIPPEGAVDPMLEALNQRRGVLLTSSYEYPGRYTRWDIGFVDPPVCLESSGRRFHFHALNERGRRLLPILAKAVRNVPAVVESNLLDDSYEGIIAAASERFAEEERSKQPSIFSVVRAVAELFANPADRYLGLYGAFGYDLALQFEPLRLRQKRPEDQRDLVLYLPDELLVVDHRLERAAIHSYDFEFDGASTRGLARETVSHPYSGGRRVNRTCDHEPGEYAAAVSEAREAFKRGDLFEVVPGQTFFEPCPEPLRKSFAACDDAIPRPTASLSIWEGPNIWLGPRLKCMFA